MKLVVFGATGGIGSQVMAQALEAGHEVVAVARRPDAITHHHMRLSVVQGDVLEAATLTDPVAGAEAVIAAIGARDRRPTTVYSQGITNILQAMQLNRIRRLFCISASGLQPGPRWQRIIAKPLLWAAFKAMYTDLVRMEAVVKRSTVDWTIMRPPRLTNGPRTGKYQVAVNAPLRRGMKISRADVADYVLKHIETAESRCGVVELAY